MAGSRYHRIGTIFSRITGLLKSGAMNPEDKPIWYSVYEAFPPKLEPRYDRPESTIQIKSILYPEDILRAKFYKKYGSIGIFNLSETSRKKSVSQLFIEEYQKLKEGTCLSEDELWMEAVASLEAKGIRIENNKQEPSNKPEPDLVKLKLSDIFSKEAKKLQDTRTES